MNRTLYTAPPIGNLSHLDDAIDGENAQCAFQFADDRLLSRQGLWPEVSSGIVPRIIVRLEVVKAQWSNRSDLGNVLTRFCPMEMGCIAR